jgi:hypothetical protein
VIKESIMGCFFNFIGIAIVILGVLLLSVPFIGFLGALLIGFGWIIFFIGLDIAYNKKKQT